MTRARCEQCGVVAEVPSSWKPQQEVGPGMFFVSGADDAVLCYDCNMTMKCPYDLTALPEPAPAAS